MKRSSENSTYPVWGIRDARLTRRRFLQTAAGLLLQNLVQTTPAARVKDAPQLAAVENEPLTYTSKVTITDPHFPLQGNTVEHANVSNVWQIEELSSNPGIPIEGAQQRFYKVTGIINEVIGDITTPEVQVEYLVASSEIVPPFGDDSWKRQYDVYDNCRPILDGKNFVTVTNPDGTNRNVEKAVAAVTNITQFVFIDTNGTRIVYKDYEIPGKKREIRTSGHELRLYCITGVSGQSYLGHIPDVYLPDAHPELQLYGIPTQTFTFLGRDIAYDTECRVALDPNKVIRAAMTAVVHGACIQTAVGVDPQDEAILGKVITQIIVKKVSPAVAGAYASGNDYILMPDPSNPHKDSRVPSITILLNKLGLSRAELGTLDVIAHELFHSLDYRQLWEIIEKKRADIGEFSSIEEAMAVLAMMTFAYIEGNVYLVNGRCIEYFNQYFQQSNNSFTTADYFLFILPLYLANKYGVAIDEIEFMRQYLNARDVIKVRSIPGYNSIDPAHIIHYLASQTGYAGELLRLQDAHTLLLLDLLQQKAPTGTFLRPILDSFFNQSQQCEYTNPQIVLELITAQTFGPILHSWGWHDVGPIKSCKITASSAVITREFTTTEKGNVTIATQTRAVASVAIPQVSIYIKKAGQSEVVKITTQGTETEVDLTEAIRSAQGDSDERVRILILNETPSDGGIAPRAVNQSIQESAGVVIAFHEVPAVTNQYLPVISTP